LSREAQTLQDFASYALRLAGPAPENWTATPAGVDHDVAIVGGGQTGSSFAYALRRIGIAKITVIDAAADEARAGVWRVRARMNKLRTLKTLVGPELGNPALSFQAWYEARHGAEAYAAIDRIGRTDWADYLDWYRRTLGIEVRYSTRLLRIEPVEEHFRLHLDVDGERKTETARKIILANGVAGSGGAFVPDVLAGLPNRFYTHTSHEIDFSRLKGKIVAVIGAAASAFDAAAVALERGAAEVHLFARRKHIAATPVIRARAFIGALDNYVELPDALRWRQAVRYQRSGSTPPIDAIQRATAFPNFFIHLASEWTSARIEDERILAQTSDGLFRADFAIAGTGYFVDPSARPELAAFADRILLWRDRYEPPEDERNDYLGAHPYLGAGYELLEKNPGSAPYLRNIHVFNPGAFVSFGLPVGDVPSLRKGVPAVVARISRDLFFADFEEHQKRFETDIPPDFDESLYASAIWRQPADAAAE
jgi:cation diffusion facilitator CzcD-associated flavoprotein CzcO